MRRLGLLLLLVGFGWLALQQITIVLRADLRAVGEAQYAKLSQDPNHRYSGQEVRDHIRETALAVNARFPVVLAPGTLMLAGGLLLAFAHKRPGGQNAA